MQTTDKSMSVLSLMPIKVLQPLCVILRSAKRMQYLQIHNSVRHEVEHELVFSMQCDYGNLNVMLRCAYI